MPPRGCSRLGHKNSVISPKINQCIAHGGKRMNRAPRHSWRHHRTCLPEVSMPEPMGTQEHNAFCLSQCQKACRKNLFATFSRASPADLMSQSIQSTSIYVRNVRKVPQKAPYRRCPSTAKDENIKGRKDGTCPKIRRERTRWVIDWDATREPWMLAGTHWGRSVMHVLCLQGAQPIVSLVQNV